MNKKYIVIMADACEGVIGVVLGRGSTRMSTVVPRQGAGNYCPDTHPYAIPNTNCCAQGRDLFAFDRRVQAKKRVSDGPALQAGSRKRQDDGDSDEEMAFGKKKTRSFNQFRKEYKKNHKNVSDHTILVKYISGLVRLRGMY